MTHRELLVAATESPRGCALTNEILKFWLISHMDPTNPGRIADAIELAPDFGAASADAEYQSMQPEQREEVCRSALHTVMTLCNDALNRFAKVAPLDTVEPSAVISAAEDHWRRHLAGLRMGDMR